MKPAIKPIIVDNTGSFFPEAGWKLFYCPDCKRRINEKGHVEKSIFCKNKIKVTNN